MDKAELLKDIHGAIEVYHLLRKGDPITDRQLDNAIVVFGDVVKFLEGLGPRFHFVYRALDDDLRTMRQFWENRKERR